MCLGEFRLLKEVGGGNQDFMLITLLQYWNVIGHGWEHKRVLIRLVQYKNVIGCGGTL